MGNSAAGDPVEVVNEAGDAIAHGISNFDSSELPQMLGRSTDEMRASLGDDFVRSVVHRDELTLVSPTVTDIVTGRVTQSGIPVLD